MIVVGVLIAMTFTIGCSGGGQRVETRNPPTVLGPPAVAATPTATDASVAAANALVAQLATSVDASVVGVQYSTGFGGAALALTLITQWLSHRREMKRLERNGHK